jgi:outer membrane protein OmpA-like peptidoglycan-associated protein
MFCLFHKRLVLSVLAVCVVAALAAPAVAQEQPKYELGLQLGAGLLDRDLMGNAEKIKELRPLLGLRAAKLGEHFNLFTDATWGTYDTIDPTVDVKELTFRLGGELLLPELSNHSRFFLSAALGWMDVNYALNPGAPTGGDEPRGFDRSFASIGVGQRFCVGDFKYWRWEARADNTLSDDGVDGKDLTNYKFLIGYSIGKGGPPPDEDGDGVKNCYDECPKTPRGCTVNEKGCPSDSDGDGVCDGIDQCPDTPQGWPVDAKGCPIDTDADGVPDGGDACPNTTKGCSVDAKGCPMDTDGDGVCDGLDRCPNTTKGCKVDVSGCPLDSDGDGVCDGIDQCPNTPAGRKVDSKGCPIPLAAPLFAPAQKTLVLRDVNFDSDKATLTPASLAILDDVAVRAREYPDVRVEIGGHCDSTNTEAHNQKLSEARANTVFQYLVAKGVAANRMVVKGYGESKPIADNKTKEGRAENRRVELTKLD